MDIFIKYSSKWNLSSRSETGASATKNLSYSNLSKGTCLGVLSRLMGQVDKMNSLKADFPLLNKIEQGISFEEVEIKPLNDIIFLRSHSQTDGDQQGGMAGKILENDLFKDSRVIKGYGVLYLSVEEILSYLLTGKINDSVLDEKSKRLSPSLVWGRTQEILASKIVFDENTIKDLKKQSEIFSKAHGLVAREKKNPDKETKIYASSIYNFALNKYYQENIKSLKDFADLPENIPGFAASNPLGSITPRAWMNLFSSRTKLTTGTFIDSLNKDVMPVGTSTKQDGLVKITLAGLNESERQFILESIESNGVSSFILGKKGLAYVDKIVL